MMQCGQPAKSGAAGHQEPLQTLQTANLEAVQSRIMGEIQAKLFANQEDFWRRGQVEIKRLQQQQNEVVDTLAKMQEQQAELAAEHQRVKGALVEVTSKFEQVVKQMREVIWALPPHAWQGRSSSPCKQAADAADADGKVALCTPPRTSPQDQTTWPAPGSSPAVLSLASALPSDFKRLNLAEWIDQVSPGKSTETPSLPTRSKRMSLSSQETEEARQFQVEIVKETGFTTLGIEVNQEDGALLVDHIDEHGLVGNFNAKEDSARQILVGDSIVEVNGIQDPEQMLKEIKVSQALLLVLLRTQVRRDETDAMPGTHESLSLETNPRVLRQMSHADKPISSKSESSATE
ncbi:unnamed protein product [Durusdinium trenchii]|uniref:PDZ domain-containing protein n=1 Tax=Durusdinium trenchii TaxID=1381693 RepID=A0ABP0L082_9DINO